MKHVTQAHKRPSFEDGLRRNFIQELMVFELGQCSVENPDDLSSSFNVSTYATIITTVITVSEFMVERSGFIKYE